jgi:hypothetical protein
VSKLIFSLAQLLSELSQENPMLLKIANFRAVKDQEVELAPITVVYGANSAGKSSLILALLTLKAAILNSNTTTSGFFNYGFTSLGGFDAVVYDHLVSNKIGISLKVPTDGGFFAHGVTFGETQGSYTMKGVLDNLNFNVELPVTFPYPGNGSVTATVTREEEKFGFTWNGITAQSPANPQLSPMAAEFLNRIMGQMNAPAELLRKVGMVPLRRGFSKPVYQTQPLTPALITEDEVATYLSNNKYLESKVSHYLEKVLNQDFRVHVQPGTAIFSLDATDRKTGLSTELVNEGFGVNQMVYFLAKALNPDVAWTCVEEPEIHLHPSAVRRFARALNEMVTHEGKNFVVSTHSEGFVLALLSLIAEERVSPERFAFYFAEKKGRYTEFERQVVHANGQIQGGLTSFMGGEIEDLKSLLNSTQ